jgi:hypothetical protein
MSSHFSGQLVESGLRNSQDTARAAGVRDLEFRIPSFFCSYFTTPANWVLTRTAAGRLNHTHSNVDETSIIQVSLSRAMLVSAETADTVQVEAARGPRINWIDAVWLNPTTGGSVLDAAPTLAVTTQPTFTDGATIATGTAVAVTNSVTSVVTASDTVVRRPRWTIDTPAVMASNVYWDAELTVNSSATSDLQFYGFVVGYDILL